MDAVTVLEEVRRIADRFAADRHERQRRERLVPEEFDELAAAGFLLTGVPTADGGLFESVPESTRTVGSVLNALARGDASVALVASMHPAVLSFWHASPEAPPEHQKAWSEQRAYVSRMAADGSWFGTITSSPAAAATWGAQPQRRSRNRTAAGASPGRSTSAADRGSHRSC